MRHERVIRGAKVVADEWSFFGLEDGEVPATLPAGPAIVPLHYWQAHRGVLGARGQPCGVWLGPADDPLALAEDAARLPLVAVRFPKFTDGRGYSTAVLLRTRLRFGGELRAFGDVGRDQLFYLRRCGFDAFNLPAGRDLEAAIAGLSDFRFAYQGAAADPVPLFRRRLLEGNP